MAYGVILKFEIGDHSVEHFENDVLFEDLKKFQPIIKAIQKSIKKTHYNWFSRSEFYSSPIAELVDKVVLKFGIENISFDFSMVQIFFDRFTPMGADRISKIEVIKYERTKL